MDKITDLALEAFGDTTKTKLSRIENFLDVTFGIAVIRYKGVFEPKVSRYRKTSSFQKIPNLANLKWLIFNIKTKFRQIW